MPFAEMGKHGIGPICVYVCACACVENEFGFGHAEFEISVNSQENMSKQLYIYGLGAWKTDLGQNVELCKDEFVQRVKEFREKALTNIYLKDLCRESRAQTYMDTKQNGTKTATGELQL